MTRQSFERARNAALSRECDSAAVPPKFRYEDRERLRMGPLTLTAAQQRKLLAYMRKHSASLADAQASLLLMRPFPSE